jgi:phosphopantothenoylcysteine decarboxylase/phosphopantothenate--cysteine ligase
MRCVVTAGPTFEPLDNVRRLTNFSTGRLGSELAMFLSSHGHEVRLLLGEQSTYRIDRPLAQVEIFTTTGDLRNRLRALASKEIDAVFHAAAVSDFTFGKVWIRSSKGELNERTAGKLSTREGTLLAELIPTPKILAELRDYFPKATLVGWKYEVEGDQSDVIAQVQRQLKDCRTDACVANGPAYGPGYGLVKSGGNHIHLSDSKALFEALAALHCKQTNTN